MKENHMKAAVLIGPERIEIQDVAMPSVSGSEFLVKLKNLNLHLVQKLKR